MQAAINTSEAFSQPIYVPATLTAAQEKSFFRALSLWKASDLKARMVIESDHETIREFLVKARAESERKGYHVFHHVTFADGVFHCDCAFGCKDGNICVHKMAAFQAWHAWQATLVTRRQVAARNAERAAFRERYADFYNFFTETTAVAY